MGKFYCGNYNSKFIACVGDGHGLETPGKRTPSGVKENVFNDAVKQLLFKSLKRHSIACYDVSPDRTDNSLQDRTDSANSLIKNDADLKRIIFVSIHYDAISDNWNDDVSGLSVYRYPGVDARLSSCIHKYLVQGTKQKDRGLREADFHVLRETLMPAVLTENGFMSNHFESSLMTNIAFQAEVAEEHCKGVCEYFGVNYIPIEKKEDGKLYRVQVGAFRDKSNADRLAIELKRAGYPTYIV
jgi:N-acetylmuramoyl-L-alanine amidase